MSLPTPELTDADRALIPRLATACADLDTTRVITAFYRDPAVRQILASRDPDVALRMAYVSGLVVAEVAIARRRKTA